MVLGQGKEMEKGREGKKGEEERTFFGTEKKFFQKKNLTEKNRRPKIFRTTFRIFASRNFFSTFGSVVKKKQQRNFFWGLVKSHMTQPDNTSKYPSKSLRNPNV